MGQARTRNSTGMEVMIYPKRQPVSQEAASLTGPSPESLKPHLRYGISGPAPWPPGSLRPAQQTLAHPAHSFHYLALAVPACPRPLALTLPQLPPIVCLHTAIISGQKPFLTLLPGSHSDLTVAHPSVPYVLSASHITLSAPAWQACVHLVPTEHTLKLLHAYFLCFFSRFIDLR